MMKIVITRAPRGSARHYPSPAFAAMRKSAIRENQKHAVA
jgi:hypothetical protein